MDPRCRPSRTPRSGKIITPDQIVKVPAPTVNRRTLLKVAGTGAAALASVSATTWMPDRIAHAMPLAFPDIQFDIGAFVHPAQTIANVPVQFGVTYTLLVPAKLTRNPTKSDQTVLSNALATIEANFSFSPSGVFTFVAYGIPYFNRLPGGITGSLVASHMPRLKTSTSRFVLEEAVPSPTDVSSRNPKVSKTTFNVPVQIESNDVLFTLRSDSLSNLNDIANWVQGSNSLAGKSIASPAFNGFFSFETARFNFVQPGLPRTSPDQALARGLAQ